MPFDPNEVIVMKQIDPGAMDEIPPDLPTGQWLGPIMVKPTATKPKANSKDQMPMVIVEATADECETSGNEDAVGGKCAKFIVIRAAKDSNSKFSKRDLKKMCEAYGLSTPDCSSLADGSFSSMAPWIEEVESEVRRFWTTNELDKNTGENRTNLHFVEPGKKLERAEEEEEVATKPVAKTNGAAPHRAPAKKTAAKTAQKSARR